MGLQINKVSSMGSKIKKAAMFMPVGVAAFAMVAVLGVSAASTTQVSHVDGTQGWMATTRDTGTVSVSEEFGAPAGFGESSLEFTTTTGNDKAYVKNTDAQGTPLAELELLDYSTYRSSTSTAANGQAPALNVEILTDGVNKTGYTTLVFEPIYQSGGAEAVMSDTWQNWQTGAGDAIWWSTKTIPGVASAFDSFVSLESIKAANPDAVVLSVMVNQGSGNPGLIAAVDALNVNGSTFDFELETPDTTAPVSEITSPADGAVVQGSVDVRGSVTDDKELLRYYSVVLNEDGQRVAGPGTVSASGTTAEVAYTFNTIAVEDGEYTIRLEARDAAGNKAAESTDVVTVTVNNVADNKEQCKNEGYKTFTAGFKNQGQCVASIQSNEKSRHNRQ